MKFLIPILAIFLFLACSQNTEQTIDYSKFTQITFIDTFDNELVLDTATSPKKVRYFPLYIGKRQDSIELTYYSQTDNHKYKYFEYTLNSFPDSLDLRIFIDTTKIIGSGRRIPIPPPYTEDLSDPINDYQAYVDTFFTRGRYKCYPIFIENISNDTLSLGAGTRIPSILEAQDSLGVWRPIQLPSYYGCGTGLYQISLLPNEIAITHCRIYDGNYRTKLRFVLDKFIRNNYSNEFIGTINYSQFYDYN